jgi:transposase-like protein
MAERIKKAEAVHEGRPIALGELIHDAAREAIELAVHEEVAAALGAARYERRSARVGDRNGTTPRLLTGPTGPLALTLPRGLLHTPGGAKEWTSTIVPRYERRLREVNEAVVATSLAGATCAGSAAPRGRC